MMFSARPRAGGPWRPDGRHGRELRRPGPDPSLHESWRALGGSHHCDAQFRRETRPAPGQHLDVLVRQGNTELQIELKYSTLDAQRGGFHYLALELTSGAIATNIESS